MTAVRQREVGRAFSSDTTHRELHLSVGARPRTVLRAGCTVPGPPERRAPWHGASRGVVLSVARRRLPASLPRRPSPDSGERPASARVADGSAAPRPGLGKQERSGKPLFSCVTVESKGRTSRASALSTVAWGFQAPVVFRLHHAFGIAPVPKFPSGSKVAAGVPAISSLL